MLKTLTLALASLALILTAVHADSRFKKSHWPSRIEGGALKVQGPGYGSWGTRWVTVDSGVTSYTEVGTSMGPVLVYAKGSSSSVVQLRFDTGMVQNRRSFRVATSIIRGGQYGALIRAGTTCYDYSWQQLRAIDCNTRQFK